MAQTTTISPDPEGTTSSTPAISARVLKKRETDRRCQRMIRERTKSRIAYLEGLVEQFRQQDASGRVETLMKQLSDMKDDRDTLAKKVKNIESIISDSRLKEEPDTQELVLSGVKPEALTRPTPLRIDTQQISTAPYMSPVDDLGSSSPVETPVYMIHNKEYSAHMESSSRASWAASPSHPNQPCECSTNYSALDPTQTLNKWRYANDTLTEWFKWSPQALDMAKFSAFNDDVPVRAMVEGWGAVENHGHMHPAWRLLRGIDENIFGSIDKRERLAILTVMGLLLQAHLNPTTEQHKKLPAFYLKRPSQDMLHSYATEYFAWPGLRERFVFSEHRYCSNIFWRIFCTSLRFQWQYEFRDCYVHNVETGLYQISPTFRDRVGDIRSWTMGMDMFKQYPELYGDIPAWNHIPASISGNRRMIKHPQTVLPLSSTGQESSKKQHTPGGDKSSHSYNRRQSSGQSHTPVQAQQVQNGQDVYSHFASTSHSASFATSATSVGGFEFPTTAVMTTMGEMPQVTSAQAWTYPTNLDMYQLTPT